MATGNAAASKSGLYADPREDWLALRKEKLSIQSARSSTLIIICGIAAGNVI
jgi:hypothetical protein